MKSLNKLKIEVEWVDSPQRVTLEQLNKELNNNSSTKAVVLNSIKDIYQIHSPI